MDLWLTRAGLVLSTLGVVLISPVAFSAPVINRARKRVKRVADRVSGVLKYIGWWVVGGLVFLAVSLVSAATDPDAYWFVVLTPKKAAEVEHYELVVGFVVPAAAVAVAIVAGLLFFVLWLLVRLFWLATSKRKRLAKTGGILTLVGFALLFGVTFLPQAAVQPSRRRAPISKAKRVGSVSNQGLPAFASPRST